MLNSGAAEEFNFLFFFLLPYLNQHVYSLQHAGDDPEEVKARLKYWAQAVACTVKLCN